MKAAKSRKLFIFALVLVGSLPPSILIGQTIAEKKAGLGRMLSSDLSEEMQTRLKEVNEQQTALLDQLHKLYDQAFELFTADAPDCAFEDLLIHINRLKEQIAALEEQWRLLASQGSEDGYALWHQPSTTLEQLVIDYGSQEYAYLIPQKIADITLSVSSNLPIPRASWNEMLDAIFSQNGVGVKQLNPYLRQLYLLKEDRSNLRLITNKRKDLQAFPSNERIAFVLTPEPSDVRRVWYFLEKFVNPNSVVLQMIGRDILIIAQVAEVEELLKLYDFASANKGDKEYVTVTLKRVDPTEMAKILSAMFGVFTEEPRTASQENAGQKGPPIPPSKMQQSPPSGPRLGEENGLRVIPLPEVARAVFLVGTRDEIRRAQRLICEVEEQIGESRSKVIYSYTTKHSDPEALAEVLSKIYTLLVSTGAQEEDGEIGPEDGPPGLVPPPPGVINLRNRVPLRRPYDEGFFLDNRFVINNPPPPEREIVNNNRDNFIVDLKTGAIVMVVETDILPKMKEVIRQLDIPTRMVELEVLLFEKRLRRETNFGLNLLKIGSAASHENLTSATFNTLTKKNPLAGIFQFMMSRDPGDGAPAFDLAYRFLLAQEDIHINASPSVLAINQTPATIEIAEEISVNTGIFEVETISGVTLKDAFSRAQYGIKIDITPTIHLREEDDFSEITSDYVSMVTDISFQTFRPTLNSRPNVTTRHIKNEVSIPHGQTVILGGLRQRHSHDHSEKIPFLGEIPGIGKLFSLNHMEDDTTEMFIFITPRIVYDQQEDLKKLRCAELARRPGDIPYFLCALDQALERENNRLFASSMTMLFGRKPDRCVCPLSEYDGR